jgi:phosphoglycolate phosphatase-like HAD superfamily hydrolase
MERVYGSTSAQERNSYAGKTDQQIIHETFPDRQPDQLTGDLAPFTAAYLAELTAQRDAFVARARALDGVFPALERLRAAPVVQSLLTGNLLSVAHFKLDALALSEYFDFESGAFGSDHHHRPELVPIAAARARQRYGVAFAPGDIVVIGDTPNDIACGRANGARTVAVATGSFGLDELRRYAPDALLPDLADTDSALAAILGAS